MQASLMGMASFLSSSLAWRDDLVIRGVGVDLRRRLGHHDRMGRDRAAARRAGRLPPQRSAKLMIGKSIAVRMAYL